MQTGGFLSIAHRGPHLFASDRGRTGIKGGLTKEVKPGVCPSNSLSRLPTITCTSFQQRLGPDKLIEVSNDNELRRV